MKKKCFVIMPYGSNDVDQKEYSRIYRFFIKSATDDLGLDCVRSDIDGKGGHILGNVIEDLANADIVVADLSALNWNVAYELGIRHVLSKKGTILICNNMHKNELPFDIRSLNILFYSQNWLDNVDELCDSLKKAIESRLTGRTQNDSPVHEKYAYLPENILKGFETDTDDSLKAAKTKIAQLEKELANTYEKIESMGLVLPGEANSLESMDYSQAFISELSNSIYNSDNAVAKLRELLEDGDKEEFLNFLGKVLTVGFLDESDCRAVYALCIDLNVPAITRKYLEAVTKFYPENDDLSAYLANEYSKNYHTGEKALQMVNGIIGVSKKDGKFILSKSTRITSAKLASFFDVYLHLHKYQELVEVGQLLCERFEGNDKTCAIVLRNMTLAYLNLDDLENARTCKEKLETAAPFSDTTHWLCARYEDALENYPKVVEEMETCIKLDPEDIDYYILMAGYICDNLYTRDPNTLEIIKITPKEADQYAVPFLVTALSIDRSSITRVLDFLRRNKFSAYIQPIIDAYQMNSSDYRTHLPELNYTAVNYCFSEMN